MSVFCDCFMGVIACKLCIDVYTCAGLLAISKLSWSGWSKGVGACSQRDEDDAES